MLFDPPSALRQFTGVVFNPLLGGPDGAKTPWAAADQYPGDFPEYLARTVAEIYYFWFYLTLALISLFLAVVLGIQR